MLTALLVILLLALLILFCLMPENTKNASSLVGRAYAHRGLHDGNVHVPENSLSAFSKAADAGYGMELDVRLTKDGQVVVFHDDTLKRVCGVDRAVIDCTYDELRTYALAGTAEQIPLLSDVLACVGGRVPLIVELKQVTDYKLLCTLTTALLASYHGDYCIESFDPRIVAWYRKNAPQIVRGQLACRMTKKDMSSALLRFCLTNLLLNVLSRPHFIAYCAEDMTSLPYRFVTSALGAISVGWTIRSQAEFDRQIKRGTKMIIFEGFTPNTRF